MQHSDCEAFGRTAAVLQGADGALLQNSLVPGRVYLLGTPLCLVQFEFQALYPASGKSRMGFRSASISGLTNILLDALFLTVFRWGTAGAAAATAISPWIGSLIPVLFYSRKNDSQLRGAPVLQRAADRLRRFRGKRCPRLGMCPDFHLNQMRSAKSFLFSETGSDMASLNSSINSLIASVRNFWLCQTR